MSHIIVPSRRVWTRQPRNIQGLADRWVQKSPRALFLPSVGPVDILNGAGFLPVNGPSIKGFQGCASIISNASSSSYVGFRAPENVAGSRSSKLYDVAAPPLTLITISSAITNAGYALMRGNGSGQPAYAAGAWYGSFKGGAGYVRTTNGGIQLSPEASNFDTSAQLAVTVLSIGPSTTNLWCGPIGSGILHSSSAATPTGNFYYEYGDSYRCLSIGGNYAGYATNTAAAGLFISEFSRDEAAALIDNPWGLFRARRRISYFDLGAGAGSSLNAAATGASVASGTADLTAQIALAAVGVSSAAGGAGAKVDIPLAAAGLAIAGGSAAAQAIISIGAAGLAAAAGAAGLSAGVLMAGSGAAQAGGNAALAAQLHALAAGAGLAGGQAGLAARVDAAAAGGALSTGTAAPNLSGGPIGSLNASGAAVATGDAALKVKIDLMASGQGSAGGDALLTTTITVTAAGFVQAMGAGTLRVEVPLAAFGNASSWGSASPLLYSAGEAEIQPAGITISIDRWLSVGLDVTRRGGLNMGVSNVG